MWASLGSCFSGIVDTAVAEEVGNDEFNRNAVSNGPFMVKGAIPPIVKGKINAYAPSTIRVLAGK